MFRIDRLSVLSVTLLVFALLGLISVVLTLYTSQLFHQASADSKAETIARMIGVAAQNELKELGKEVAHFANDFEQRSELRKAFRHWSIYEGLRPLIKTLDEPFHRGHALANHLSLEKLRIYGLEGRLIAESSLGSAQLPYGMDAELAMLLLSRKGVERLQTAEVLWRTPSQSYYSTVVPIGGLHIKGYLEVVVDPAYKLTNIKEILHLPVRMEATDQAAFPPESQQDPHKRVDYLLMTQSREPAFFLFGYIPKEDFDQDIRTNSVYLASLHLAVTGCALFFGYLLLLRYLILPVKKMSRDIGFALKESTQVSVKAKGLREFSELATSFNRLMNEVDAQKETLRQMSLIDALTGLANRRAFDLTLKREWQRAMRDQTPISLMLIDIDFFKRYNDTYGHQQGDHCLAHVARVVGRAATRSSDLSARYGGEEFAVILPATTHEGALKVGQRLADRVAELAMPHSGSEVAEHVTVSIGVSTCQPLGQIKADCIVQCADQALYGAKHKGRNQVNSAMANIYDDPASTQIPSNVIAFNPDIRSNR